MQFFAAIPALFGAGGTAAAGAAGTAAAAGSSLFSLSTLTTGLQIGGSLLGAMAAVRAGQAEAGQLELQARQAEADSAQAVMDGENRRVSMRRELIKQLGDQDTAYAASGLDLSFGTAADARRGAVGDAQSALARDQSNQAAAQTSQWNKAAQLRQMAKNARKNGGLKALLGVVEAGTGALARG